MTRNGPSDESSNEEPSTDHSTDEDHPTDHSTDDATDDDRVEGEASGNGEPTGESSEDEPGSEETAGGSPGESTTDEPPEDATTEEPPTGTSHAESSGEPATETAQGTSAEGSISDPAEGTPATHPTDETPAGMTPVRSVAYLGYGAVIFGLGGVLVSMVLTPWFSVFTGALSFLGFPRVAVAPVFNGGLIVGGALGTGLVAALWASAEQPFHLAAVPFLFLATVSMSLVGVFPIATGPHFTVSAAFFVFLTVGVFLWGAGDYAAGRAARAGTFLLLPAVHAAAWAWWFVLPWAPRGIALPELAGVAALAAWALWVSADLHGLTREPLPALYTGGQNG